MKLAVVLLLARRLSQGANTFMTARQALESIAIVVIPATLIAIQPDGGGAMMFLPLLAGVMLVCGIPARVLAAGALILVVLFAGLWTFAMKDYQKDRILSFVQQDRDPLGSGYQLRQSKIAVGSGQVLGRGYMQGTQSQLRFLPARHTDFIFAVLAEERGFVGVALVLLLYGVLFFSAMGAASRARDRAALLLIVGLASALAGYVLYNTAMIVGLLPITGIPLPFLSYGGSFTLFCFAAVGMIAGIDMRRYVNR